MYELENDQLNVEIIDPSAEQHLLGTRYCTGGYIFQVTDRERGPLLSGPTYPESFNVFDGQGIPDAFNLAPIEGSKEQDGCVLIIGIGQCDTNKNTVESFCVWDIHSGEQEISFRTEQSLGPYRLTLERKVKLIGRTLKSEIRLANNGEKSIEVRWFPHPFYPQPDTDELCRFKTDISMPANEGFELGRNGFVNRKNWPDWGKGFYQILDHSQQNNLVILQKHPVLGLVAATCDYVPGFFPIWGNTNTFSWEPFMECKVEIDQERNWGISYEF